MEENSFCTVIKDEWGNLENIKRHSPYNSCEMEKAKWIQKYMKYCV
jgi:hypothetical protein